MEIDAYQYWMSRIANRSPNTIKTYRILFQSFLKYVGLTPNQLIQLKQESNNAHEDPRETAVVEDKVLDWLHKGLKDKSPATTKTCFAVVMSFFNSNKHSLALDKNDYERVDSIGSEIPTKEQVVRIADATTGWKFRAAIMVLKDSGLRCSDLPLLTWEDKRDLGDGFWHWTIVTEKRGVRAQVFIGPEATRLLDGFKTKEGQLFPTRPVHMNFRLNEAIRKALDRNTRVKAHGLRKFHYCSLQHGRVPEGYILAMQGKRHSVYSEVREDELFEAYKGAYEELSLLSVKNNQALKTELAELTEKYDKLEKQVKDLMEKNNHEN